MAKMDKSPQNKPEWLQILEQQSWQAELIISGIAIFGSMQLPDVIFNLADAILVRFSDDSLNFLIYFFIYLLIGVRFLITGFIIHFVLRALWVGMLGLVSVFPEGIRGKSSNYSQDYLKKLKAEFGDINGFNQKLDNFCSLILSISAAAVQIFLIIAFWVLMVILLHNLLIMVLPKSTVNIILKVLIGIILVLSFLIAMLNFGKIKESTIAKKLQYPLSHRFNRVFAHIFYEPYLYIIMTLMTNFSLKKRHTIIGMVFFMVLTGIFGFDLPTSNIQYFPPENYFAMNQNEYASLAANYENSLGEKRILRPVIQADVITDDHIRLFIPWHKREVAARENICGKPSLPDELSREERQAIRRSFENKCMAEYYQIFIDSSLVEGIDFTTYYHHNRNEKGFLTYIPIDSLTTGRHVLKIQKGYTNEAGEKALQHILFYREKKR